MLRTVAIRSVVALSQPFAIVHHGAYCHGQLEYNVALGFALQWNITGRLDLLQITGQNGLKDNLRKASIEFIAGKGTVGQWEGGILILASI